MSNLARFCLLFGAGAGGIAVILGAFAAHGLRDKLEANLFAAFQTGVEYQFYHALALLAVGILLLNAEQRLLIWAGGAFTLGIVLFSGSLYALALTGVRGLGAITPLGGVSFVVGWVLLLAAIIRWPGSAA
ncbi:MAG: DUF423 domain-containing protein [Nevskiales bacterium]